MTKSEIESQCREYGEFYIQFEYIKKSFKGRKTTYIQGTMDFDASQDKYLAKRYEQERVKPADDEHILVFSRTGNVFRYIPVAKVRRITSLQYELDRAKPI